MAVMKPDKRGAGRREGLQRIVKARTIDRAKVNRVIGRADDETMLTVTRALALFLGLA